MKKIALIVGSPAAESTGRALAEEYRRTAEAAGAQVTLVDPWALKFDPDLTGGLSGGQTLEPDLEGAWKVLAGADHWTIVYPNWWGTYPARLKGFLDRVLLPGAAFRYGSGALPDQLLKGKTARLVVTMDGPSWWYRLVQGQGGARALRRSVLAFCGVRTVGTYHADRLRPRGRAPLDLHRRSAAALGRSDAVNR